MQSLNKHIFITIHSNIVIDSDYITIIINNLNTGITFLINKNIIITNVYLVTVFTTY